MNIDKVLCFGEILIRYSTHENFPITQETATYIGGAESNVVLALAQWNTPVAYCTAMPNNFLSEKIIAYYQKMNVDTTKIINSGERIGAYYLNQGADVKNTGVIYDRNNSSFANLNPLNLDWDLIFEGIKWFHITAISPALNATLAAICETALIAATKKGITISIDLNYREKLWKYGANPIDIMPNLTRYAHVIMGNIWAAERMLGISLNQKLVGTNSDSDFLEQAKLTSENIILNFPQCKIVANTFRFNENNGVKYFTTLYQDSKLYKSKTLFTANAIDKVGTGDCFMAGLIYGLIHKYEPQHILNFATTAAFQKLFIKGDATTLSVLEIEQLISKNE